MLRVEYGVASAVDRYVDWWSKPVRARPQRLEQLCVCWGVTAWRLALHMRSQAEFADVIAEIIEDTRGLQDALGRDLRWTSLSG